MPLMVCCGLVCFLNITKCSFLQQWIAYGIQQVDKTGLSTQATFGIKTDTHMVGNDYAWLTTIFYIFVSVLYLLAVWFTNPPFIQFLFGEFVGVQQGKDIASL